MSQPIRVLHLFGLLTESGGAENWVLRMARLRDERVRFDFLLSVDDGPLVKEMRQTGSRIHFVPFSQSPAPWSFANAYLSGVRRVVQQERYDVIHAHQFDLAGEVLRIADQENVPGRLFSVHATEYENKRMHRRLAYHCFGKPWILRHATSILPCSRAAGQAFSPRFERNDPKFEVVYYGIDTKPFEHLCAQQSGREKIAVDLRHELGIPEHARIIGHVGRFARQKNHLFLIALLAELMRDDTDLYAVLVGHGELWEPIRRLVLEKGLENRIMMPGIRGDVPLLLASLFDLLLLPSFYEGFPIISIEAMATGLPVVFSDRVTDELAAFFPGRTARVSLDAPMSLWCETVHSLLGKRLPPPTALRQIETSPFTDRASLDHLVTIYNRTQ